MKIYPLLAFLAIANALWEKLLHNQLGMAFNRVLLDMGNKPEFLTQYFMTYERLQWNALTGWAVGMVLVALTMKDPTQRDWIKYALGIFAVLSLLFCLFATV